MQISSIDFLARFLGDLRQSFGAEILDARDDMDGTIVVDVRVDAASALRVHRGIVLDRTARTLGRSRELLDHNQALQRRTAELLDMVRTRNESMRRSLEDSRSAFIETRRDVRWRPFDPGAEPARAPLEPMAG